MGPAVTAASTRLIARTTHRGFVNARVRAGAIIPIRPANIKAGDHDPDSKSASRNDDPGMATDEMRCHRALASAFVFLNVLALPLHQ
jgi:hypothetical protein